MERTEKPTPRKRERAALKGFVPRSPELTAAVTFFSGLLILHARAPLLWREALEGVRASLGGCAGEVSSEPEAYLRLLRQLSLRWAGLLFPLFGGVAASGVFAALAAGGFRVGALTIRLDPNRLNPAMGLARLFSLRTAVEAGKDVVKVVVVGLVAYLSLRAFLLELLGRGDSPWEAAALLSRASAMMWHLLVVTAVVFVVVGFLDRMYRTWEYERGLLMSREEIKEELKEVEGSPLARQRMKQRHASYARRRMIAAVRSADVVVANPEHYAVALRYRPLVDEAPRVVAKGRGELAVRIKEEARKANVVVVRDEVLAKTLYVAVKLDHVIPPELYQAVAEVLAFVYKSRGVKAEGISA